MKTVQILLLVFVLPLLLIFAAAVIGCCLGVAAMNVLFGYEEGGKTG